MNPQWSSVTIQYGNEAHARLAAQGFGHGPMILHALKGKYIIVQQPRKATVIFEDEGKIEVYEEFESLQSAKKEIEWMEQ